MAIPKTTQPVAVNPHIEMQICIQEEHERHIPKRRRAPEFLPADAPVPRVGEIIYLGSSSPWRVKIVIHQWRDPAYLRVEIWIEPARTMWKPSGFAVMQ